MSTASPAPVPPVGEPPDPVARLRRVVESGPVAPSRPLEDDVERPELDTGRPAELPEWAPAGSARAALLGGFSLGRAGGMALLAAVLVLAGFALAHLLRAEPSEVSAPSLPGLVEAGAPASGLPASGVLTSAAPATTGAGTGGAAGEDSATVVASVVGLVGRPGLVTLGPSPRVADALAAAGGALPDADTTALNLAQIVADGEQIVVGVRPPEGGAPAGSQVLGAGGGLSGGAAPAAQGGGGTGGEGKGGEGRVNLNSATAAELEGLSGVGPATSAAIIDYRESHGPFTDVEQLGEVRGIGPAKLAALRDAVTV